MSTRIVFLTLNDIYEHEKIEGRGGLAEMGTLIESTRAQVAAECKANGDEEMHIVLTVNGDFLSASETAMIHKGKHMVELLNVWNIDFVVAGNRMLTLSLLFGSFFFSF
jgi:2',3'-cyclic-nucleotide 2'-phosphodiesterase (5'-nucleotidase family)